MYCLQPAIARVPKGDWFCPECKWEDREQALLRVPPVVPKVGSQRVVTRMKAGASGQKVTAAVTEGGDPVHGRVRRLAEYADGQTEELSERQLWLSEHGAEEPVE